MKDIILTLKNIDQVAEDLVKYLRGGDILALSGSLASGKTTLTKAICQALGSKNRVTSPTFVLEHNYQAKHNQIKEIMHLDFYRLGKKDLDSFDWQESLNDRNRITIIEWPQIVQSSLPSRVKTISLRILDHDQRQLTFSSNFTG